ncbi:H/ACA ribonucleoprotein complex subunit 1, putative [Hepatocystis sp. ex Piliocolobus tephrosceles]|nr:H/ACA ribonucleoprotein complex subunit 1, putative [Hepatocystis sp. ex Piliocolobus tephrosceles]
MGFFNKNRKGNFNRSYDSNIVRTDNLMISGSLFKCCENDLVLKNKLQNLVPYFNGRILLKNNQEIGKVNEILGPINEYYFSVKLKEGIMAKSFTDDTEFFIDQSQTLPLSRFLPTEDKKTPKKKKSKKKKTNKPETDNKNSNFHINTNFQKKNNFFGKNQPRRDMGLNFGGDRSGNKSNRNDWGGNRQDRGGNDRSGNDRGGNDRSGNDRSGNARGGNQNNRFNFQKKTNTSNKPINKRGKF